MILRSLAAGAVLVIALPAAAAISIVTPDVDGTYVGYAPVLPQAAGNYGVELRQGNRATNGTWEIGAGKRTSVGGNFAEGQFAWGANPVAFTLSWLPDAGANALVVTVGGTTVRYDAPLNNGFVTDTLKIDVKGDATLFLATLDGQVFNQSFTPVNFGILDAYFFSPDNWGANGFTATGTVRIGSARSGGSASGVQFKVGDFTPNPGVPEPATWAMLIAGFGLVGAAMRRRNGQGTTAAR